MTIKITRQPGGYLAIVTPSPKLPAAWSTTKPMPRQALFEKLVEFGYHLQDIVDAFFFADAINHLEE
jgi:hypothetical protein